MKKLLQMILCLALLIPAYSRACDWDSQPIAIISDLSEWSKCRNATFSFDGHWSYDPDDIPGGHSPSQHPGAGIVSYSWSFGDGSTGSGATTSHTYTAAGTFRVRLTVRDNEGNTKWTDTWVYVYEVAAVWANGVKTTGQTFYAALPHLDDPSSRVETYICDVWAIANPGQYWFPNCFHWSPGGGLPRIDPNDCWGAGFYAKDHGTITITATCGDSSKSMQITIAGVDLQTSVPANEETTKTYNIAVNNTFDQKLDDPNLPGHADCLKADKSDFSVSGDNMAEFGTVQLYLELQGDDSAQVKLSYDSDGLHIFKDGTFIQTGNWYPAGNLQGELKVEGAYSTSGSPVTATIKTQDNREASDVILIKAVELDLTAVWPAPLNDGHEICHKDKMIIQVNNNDSDLDGLTDCDPNDVLIDLPDGDPDLATITLQKPPYITNDDLSDPNCAVTLTIPANLKGWKSKNKSAGAINAVSTYTLSQLPLTVYLEGLQPSENILDTLVKAEMTLNSGVKCFDEIRYTVIDVDLDMEGVDDAKEEAIGGFIALNDDDDDDNHVADKDENGPITSTGQPDSTDEDNLVKITLQKVLPTVLTGPVTLRAGSGIKVWENATKGGTIITLPKQYNTPAELPKELYVEGTERSSSVRENFVRLEYEIGERTFKDEIKLTVIDVEKVEVDSTADADSYKIASVLPANQVPDEHFVTVKGIAGDITLKATIVPDTAETRELLTWTGMTQDATDKLKATMARGSSGKFPAKVKVNGKTAHSLTNWVVWSSGSGLSFSVTPSIYLTHTSIEVDVSSDFLFTITPQAIIADVDHPKLDGGGGSVPGATQTHVVTGNPLLGGVNFDWDESRQIRVKLLNPHLYTKSQLPSVVGHLFDGQPATVDIPEDYPTSDVIGNDDTHTTDEDNDPYNAPDIGKLRGSDNPTTSMIHSEGSDGDTFEWRLHFREFARLKLGSKWYRISDYVLWKAHYKYKRVNGLWTDDGSFGAADNSGW